MKNILSVKFKTIVSDKVSKEYNPFKWKGMNTEDYFKIFRK